VYGRRPLSSFLCALLLVIAPAASSVAQQPGEFAAATAAFESGDYEQALRLFEAARAAGVDSAALHYNLGVCQYRLGDHAAAAATFARLRERFPPFAAIAEYNRGLALLGLGDEDEAHAAFEHARDEGDEPLAALAASALASMEPAAAPRARWLGYFDFAAGHDDNIALIDELSVPATLSASSPFTELVGYASRRFGQRVPLRLDFSGYLVRYSDSPEFDQEALSIDSAFEWRAGDWRIEAGPRFAESTLDGDGFERALGARFVARRPLSQRTTFDAQLVYDDVTAASGRFDFIEGTRERLRIGLDSRGERQRVRVGYEIEANDRASAGVSPSRDRFVVNYQKQLGTFWSLDGTLAYRSSDYDELVPPRKEELTEFAATARRSLANGWLLGLQYRLADNDASVAQYSYRSNRVTIAIGKSF
jgi:tetratricopeptide (TPR) repeat protein